MKNYAQELFLLTTTLSQLSNRDMIIKLFIESMDDIFDDHFFAWFSGKPAQSDTIFGKHDGSQHSYFFTHSRLMIMNF